MDDCRPILARDVVAVGPTLRRGRCDFDTQRAEVAVEVRGAVLLDDLLVGSHAVGISTFRANDKHKLSLDPPLPQGQFVLMGIGARIAKARKAADLSQAALGAAVGQGQTTISSWERGRTEPTREDVARISLATHIPIGEIELGAAQDGASEKGFPRIGKVGGGGEGLYADDYAQGAAAEYIEPLPGMPVDQEIIVLDVDGDSMAPAVFDGDLAFFGPVRQDVDALLNKRVMARLTDGRKFFKVLKKGSSPGQYTLRSLNPTTADIEDVEVSWVLPYRGSRPKDF